MTSRINDPEVRVLAKIARSCKRHYTKKGHAPWAGSPFEWMVPKISSRQRGKIGEQLIKSWLENHGLKVEPSKDTQADLLVAGHRCEVKFSTLWEKGIYKFQQIRKQNYDFLICLGISPFDAHCWVIPKAVAWNHATSQHTGKSGKETRWLSINPAKPDDWLKEYGGSLRDAYNSLLRQLKDY